MKLRCTQIRLDTDFEKLYETSPKKKLCMLRNARKGSIGRNEGKKAAFFVTNSEQKCRKKAESVSFEGIKRGRLELTETREAKSVLHSGLRQVLGEANRLL